MRQARSVSARRRPCRRRPRIAAVRGVAAAHAGRLEGPRRYIAEAYVHAGTSEPSSSPADGAQRPSSSSTAFLVLWRPCRGPVRFGLAPLQSPAQDGDRRTSLQHLSRRWTPFRQALHLNRHMRVSCSPPESAAQGDRRAGSEGQCALQHICADRAPRSM